MKQIFSHKKSALAIVLIIGLFSGLMVVAVYLGRDFFSKNQQSDINQTEKNVQYQGTIQTMEPPADDIDYRYVLVFDEPQKIDNATGLPTTADVVLLSTSDETEAQIQALVGSRVNVKGYLDWGYAETRVLYVTEVSKEF